jgi:hypothetical protein
MKFIALDDGHKGYNIDITYYSYPAVVARRAESEEEFSQVLSFREVCTETGGGLIMEKKNGFI